MAWNMQSFLALTATSLLTIGCGGPAAPSSEAQEARPPHPFLPPPDASGVTPDQARNLGLPYLNLIVNHHELERLHADPEADVEISTHAVVADKEFFPNVELQIHGGSSRGYPKKSYQIKFAKGQTPKLTSLFGGSRPEKRRTYILAASWQDPSYLRHRISYEMIRRMGGESPRTHYAIVAFNSTFHGLYLVTEKVDDDFLETNGLEEDGLLLKAEGGLAAPWKKKTNPVRGMELKSKTKDRTVRAIMDDFWNTLFDAPVTREGLANATGAVLDLESFHRWQMANSYANNMDAWLNNYFLYRPMEDVPEGGRAPLRVISWDFDAAWGHIWDGSRNDPHRTGWHNIIGQIIGFARRDGYGWYGWDGFSKRLYAVREFCETYRTKYLNALAGPANPRAIFADIDATYQLIAPAARLDLDAWNRGRDLDKDVAWLKEAVLARYDLMQKELPGACERGTLFDSPEPSLDEEVPTDLWPIEK